MRGWIIIFLILLLTFGCGTTETGTKGILETTGESGIEEADAKLRIQSSQRFKVSDLVGHVLKVNFGEIPAYFYPDRFFVGEILEIKDDGFVIVKWANGKTTLTNPDILGKYTPTEVKQ